MAFKRLLTPEAQRKIAEADEHYERKLIEVRNMTPENLRASARYYMSQMREPWKHEFACPTYDAVFWHIFVPEMIRRLGGKDDTTRSCFKGEDFGVQKGNRASVCSAGSSEEGDECF